ncbi:MAG: hypothetical protein RIR11_4023 [Bacteroidota bacterium]
MKKITHLLFVAVLLCLQLSAQTVQNVNPLLFLEDGTNVKISTISCTLSNGTSSTCYKIISTSMPTDHDMGPWCPNNISDDASAGGIWLEDGEVYDVDGEFIKNMATFYNDNTWLMYDALGNIYTTETQADCAAAANPNVGAEYKNFCVECLPSYVAGLTQTYVIPVKPVKLNQSIPFGGMGGPPGGGGGPSVRGVAFNGVRFDAPAPTNAILNAYTLAPFDDAGGHINLMAGYHYHAATGVSTKIVQCDNHAPMIGYALDGHGIYAHLNKDGIQPTDLDACRGHYDDTRGYHYHVDYAGKNNFINCLYGAYVTNSGTAATIDADNDGFSLLNDCNDNNAAVHPNAVEIDNNDIDENCDGIFCTAVSTYELAGASISLYPNPVSTMFMIEVQGALDFHLRIFDINGKLVYEKDNQGFVSTEKMSNGTYIIEITDLNSGQRLMDKIIVSK